MYNKSYLEMATKTCKMDSNENTVITKKTKVSELKEIARKRGLKGYSHMKKAALLSLLCVELGQSEDLGVRKGYGYQDKTKEELIAMAKKAGVKGATNMSKKKPESAIDKVELKPLKYCEDDQSKCEKKIIRDQQSNRYGEIHFTLKPKNLHKNQFRRLITEISPYLKQTAKLVVSFKALIFREGKITPYHKAFMSLPPFSSQK